MLYNTTIAPALFLFFVGLMAQPASAPASAPNESAGGTQPGEATELEPFQLRLIEEGFKVASSYPLVPHGKNRSLAQLQFVDLLLEMGQVDLALKYSQDILDYRRGLCYADIAMFYAKQGKEQEALAYITWAKGVAGAPNVTEPRIAKILMRMARAYAYLGDFDSALKLMTVEVIGSSGDGLIAAEVFSLAEATFDQKLRLYNSYIESGEFEQIKAAIWGLGHLYKAFSHDKDKRERALEKLLEEAKVMPPAVWGTVYLELAEHAEKTGDVEQTADLVGRAEKFMEQMNWPISVRGIHEARLAQLQYGLGDEQKAVDRLDAALEQLEPALEALADYKRCEALRPIAEGYAGTGRRDKALALYKRLFEMGVENPNLRPRISDFTATCASLAQKGLEPDEELWQTIERVHQEIVQQ